MINFVPPFMIFVLGALLIPFLKGRARQVYTIFLPILAFLNLLMLPEGTGWTINFLDYELILLRVDKLSMVFAYIFVIMGFAGAIFAAHEKDTAQLTAAFIYAGSSLGVVFAGDYLTLFIFWEMMAFSSVMLVYARDTLKARGAAFRYILVHLFGGLLLFIGILMHVSATGSLEFNFLGLSGLASILILLGFALNAAIPPLSAWLTDAYPESTVIGTVFLSAFTTKTAVYTLARGFPGTEILIYAGVFMIIYGIVFAILENDMRRVLSYSIINQVGFMVTGIGIGTAMAINGAASHAFAHILYKALLMMSAGAVLYMTGRSKCTELGGLYKTMPITLIFCCVGAASISAFPLTGGFVTKSMINSAAGYEGMVVIWLLLTLASAGVFLHAGIKFPYFVFFAKDSGLRPKEPPVNMLVAMGFLSFMCILIGVYPQILYNILPNPVSYAPYTGDHIISQLQLLMFSALAFFMLLKFLKRTDTITLDTDWVYRRAASTVVSVVGAPLAAVNSYLGKLVVERIPNKMVWFGKNPLAVLKLTRDRISIPLAKTAKQPMLKEQLAKDRAAYPRDTIRPWSISSAVSIVLVFFVVYLVIFYF